MWSGFGRSTLTKEHMTAVVGFPLETVYTIVNVTQSNPGVVTLSAVTGPNSMSLGTGYSVNIQNVVGMTELNRGSYIVGNLDTEAFTFSLYDLQFKPVDTSSFHAYVSGGQVNIYSTPPTAGNPPGLIYNNN